MSQEPFKIEDPGWDGSRTLAQSAIIAICRLSTVFVVGMVLASIFLWIVIEISEGRVSHSFLIALTETRSSVTAFAAYGGLLVAVLGFACFSMTSIEDHEARRAANRAMYCMLALPYAMYVPQIAW